MGRRRARAAPRRAGVGPHRAPCLGVLPGAPHHRARAWLLRANAEPVSSSRMSPDCSVREKQNESPLLRGRRPPSPVASAPFVQHTL